MSCQVKYRNAIKWTTDIFRFKLFKGPKRVIFKFIKEKYCHEGEGVGVNRLLEKLPIAGRQNYRRRGRGKYWRMYSLFTYLYISFDPSVLVSSYISLLQGLGPLRLNVKGLKFSIYRSIIFRLIFQLTPISTFYFDI